jgi:pyruvate/oxaloacetate carboxyltransferase
MDKAIEMVNRCHDLGYETTVNIMAISKEIEPDTIEALDQLAKCPVNVVYVVDSFGAMYCEQIEYLVKLFRKHLPENIEIGMHCHNNMQLAFSNTIEGIIHNANFLDASLYRQGAGQLSARIAGEFSEESQVQAEPHPESHRRADAADAEGYRVGLFDTLYDYWYAERASASGN